MGGVGFGTISLTETNSNGCSATKEICVEIIPIPRAWFEAVGYGTATNINVCLHQLITFKDLSEVGTSIPIETWHWDFGDGTSYSSTTNAVPQHSYSTPGTYTVTLTVKNQCNCTDVMQMQVEVGEEEFLPIECASVVCENTTTNYIISNHECAERARWTVVGGNILNQIPGGIEVIWDKVDEDGFGYVYFNNSDCGFSCGGVSVVKIPVIAQNGTIKGPPFICSGLEQVYRLPAWPGTVFNWTITGSVSGNITPLYTDQPNEVVITSQHNETITIHCTYSNSLLKCNGTAELLVEVQSPAGLTGPITACNGQNVQYQFTTGSSGSWNWLIKQPNGTTQNITGVGNNPYNLNNVQTGLYTIGIKSTEFCVPEPIQLKVVSGPASPDVINGVSEVCTNVPYTFTAGNVIANHQFFWEIVQGTAQIQGSANGNNVVVIFTGNGPWQLSVKRVNVQNPQCFSTALIKNITKAAVPTNIITGNAEPCPNTYVHYSSNYTAGEVYEWSIVPATAGSVVNGNGTPNIQVLWNNNSAGTTKTIRLEVRKCGLLYVRTYNVNVLINPTITITADTIVCREAPLTFMATLSPAVASPLIEWNFGDGVIASGGTVVSHTYTNLSTTNLNFAVTAKILSAAGCTNITPTISAPINIEVIPAPVISITPVWVCVSDIDNISIPVTASLQTGYGTTNQIIWHTPSGNSVCNEPFTGCNPFIVTQLGAYYATAVGANGCTSNSEELIIADCNSIDSCLLFTDTTSFTVNTTCNSTVVTANMPTPLPNTTQWNVLTNNLQNVNTTFNTWQGTFTQPGHYVLEFKRGFVQDTIICWRTEETLVTVPVIPLLNTTIICSSGNNYDVNMINSSNYLPGTIFNSYTFYVYNAAGTTLLQSQTVTHPTGNYPFSLTPGTYQIKMAVNYTYNGITETCSTALETIVLDIKPTAAFTFNSNYRCEGVPVQFNNLSTPTNNVTYNWNFGDGATVLVTNPSRVYNFGDFPITLTVTNTKGCTATATEDITISENNIKSQTNILPSSSIICSGSTQSLQLVNNSIVTPVYYRWMQDPTISLATTTHPINYYTVNQTGLYWVRVEDANLCYDNTPAVSVAVLPLLQPVINGNRSQCAYTPFSLTGYVGNENEITYTWYRNGQLVIQPANSYTLTEDAGLAPGTYVYTVTATTTQGSLTCTQTSANFTVTVLTPPTPPAIYASLLNCNAYTLQLTGSHTQTGNYNWSNGSSGNIVTVDKGGFYKLWFTAANGCTAVAEIAVDKDPQGYTWIVPTGCYNLCLPEDPLKDGYTLPGPIIPFAYWQWNLNNTALLNGTNSLVQPLTLLTNGSYSLQLQNSFGCTAQSGALHFSIPDHCLPVEVSCHFEPSLQIVQVIPNDDGSCTLILEVSMYNYNNIPVAYSVQALQGGTLIAAGGIAAPGTTTHQTIQFIPQIQGGNTIRLTYWLPGVPEPCIFEFDMDVNCSSGRYAGTVKPVKKGSSVTSLNTTVLQVYPNPVSSIANIQYQTAQPNSKLLLYNIMGKIIQSIPLSATKGSYVLPMQGLAKGMYWLVLVEQGVIQAKQTILKQ